jgi:hypothetical protein
VAYLINANPSPFLHLASGLATPAYTLTFWIKATAYGSGAQIAPALYVTTGGTTPTDGLGVEDEGSGTDELNVGNIVGGPEILSGLGANFFGWTFYAFQVSAGGAWAVYQGTETLTPSVLVSGAGLAMATDLYLGSPFGNAVQNGSYDSVKYWRAALTTGQILAEAQRNAPQLATGLYSYLSCDNGSTVGLDQSGGGHNWTVSGAFATNTDTPEPSFASGALLLL